MNEQNKRTENSGNNCLIYVYVSNDDVASV